MSKINLSSRIRYAVENGQTTGLVWVFETARFQVSLRIEHAFEGYQYDGDDENGETQAALDSGAMIAFDSSVIVEMDGEEIARDELGESVYYANKVAEFWQAHRDSDPMNRNCSIMRAAKGNVSICHYFPDMIRSAIEQARDHVNNMRPLPRMRKA